MSGRDNPARGLTGLILADALCPRESVVNGRQHVQDESASPDEPHEVVIAGHKLANFVRVGPPIGTSRSKTH
jgi:hypothetical protein